MISRSAAPIVGLALFLLSVGVGSASADDDAGLWQQYRHTQTNNAVISSGLEEIHSGSISTPNEVRATPVIADGTMFVGNHNSGDLQAYDLADGEEIWHAQAPNWVHSEMVYSDGAVFVGYGNRYMDEDQVRGTEDSGVLALDADTGEELWQLEADGEVMPTPAIIDGSLYAATGDRHLYEIDPETGEAQDRADLRGNVNMSSPAVEGDTLYVAASGTSPNVFTAYDTQAQETAWQTEFSETRSMGDVPPAVDEGVVTVTATIAVPRDESVPEDEWQDRERHLIYAMDADDGQVLWEDELGEGNVTVNNRSGAPMIHDGTIYVGSPTTGTSYAYDLHSGEQLWSYPTGDVKGAPVAQDGTVYFSTTGGWVYALDVEDGTKVGERHLGGALAPAGPIIVDDLLVVGSQDSHVYLTPLDQITSDGEGFSWPVSVMVALAVLTAVLVVIVIVQARQLRPRRMHRHET